MLEVGSLISANAVQQKLRTWQIHEVSRLTLLRFIVNDFLAGKVCILVNIFQCFFQLRMFDALCICETFQFSKEATWHENARVLQAQTNTGNSGTGVVISGRMKTLEAGTLASFIFSSSF